MDGWYPCHLAAGRFWVWTCLLSGAFLYMDSCLQWVSSGGVNPAIDWRPVQAVPCLLPNVIWDWLQLTHDQQWISGIDNGWMNCVRSKRTEKCDSWGKSLNTSGVEFIAAIFSANHKWFIFKVDVISRWKTILNINLKKINSHFTYQNITQYLGISNLNRNPKDSFKINLKSHCYSLFLGFKLTSAAMLTWRHRIASFCSRNYDLESCSNGYFWETAQ